MSDEPELHTLIEKLRAELDEDERIALEADGRKWGVGQTTRADWGPHAAQPLGSVIVDSDGEWPKPVVDDASHVYEEGEKGRQVLAPLYTHSRSRAQVHHAARHDPKRVLDMVTATRELIVKYEQACAYYDEHKDKPAGEVHGLYTAIILIAKGYGIDE